MTRYVLGFLIDAGYTVLIRKKRPKWQGGRLNGIGGHIEDKETPHDAMCREFEEETGYSASTGTAITNWNLFALMSGEENGGWEVYCFWAYGILSHCKTVTDEGVEIHGIAAIKAGISSLKRDTIENLPWLFSMIDSQKEDKVTYYEVRYKR